MMKKLVRILAALVVTFALTGCGISKIKDLSVSSIGVKYITPTSSRSLEGVLLLGLDNPSVAFTVSDVEGVVRYHDRDIVRFTAGELPVQARSDQVYELPCTATLCQGVSALDLIVMASKKSLEGMTADVRLNARLKKGPGIPLSFKNIDLQQFTE